MPLSKIIQAVKDLKPREVTDLTQAELDAGTPVEDILNDGLIAAMDEVGQLFSKGELYVPEMLQAAKAMQAGLEILKPFLASGEAAKRGTVIIGTVKGDLHDIGKNLVAMMLEGGGFNVVDLGVDVDTDRFIAAAGENDAGVLALSALLTTTMPAMAAAVKAVKDAGLNVKVMVGGAPVTESFAAQIGADGYSDDAPGAVETVRRLMSS